MAYESIKVDIIPGAENAEVLHFSQYDNKRPFFIELFNGADEFIPESEMTITLECRKRDGNIVIISDPVMNDNVAEFSTTEQLTACYGDNMAEIKIVDDNDLVIGSANFIINVEKSPTCGGLVSESEIDNLTQQIEDIAQEVIGEDYYNKTETDALLADKADKSELPDMTNYYTKTQTDNLLNVKVDKTTLQEDYYDADYISTQFARKSFVENYVDATATASGNPCTFDTAKYHTLIPALTADIVCGGGGTPSTPIPIVGHSELNLTRCGVNLWDASVIFADTNLFTINADGSVTQIAEDSRAESAMPSIHLEAGTYTISRNTNVGNMQLYYNDNGTWVWIVNQNTPSYTFTLTKSADIYYKNGYATFPLTFYPQIEVGSTPSAFKPYNGSPFTVAFGQTVYGGVLDVTRGKLTVTHAGVNLSDLNWVLDGSGGTVRFQTTSISPKTIEDNYTTPDFKCSHYRTLSWSNVGSEDKFITQLGGDSPIVAIVNRDYSDVGTFKASLSGAKLVYELATPIVIDVPSISVFAENGTNNITSDCIGDVNVSYKDTIQHYIDSRI